MRCPMMEHALIRSAGNLLFNMGTETLKIKRDPFRNLLQQSGTGVTRTRSRGTGLPGTLPCNLSRSTGSQCLKAHFAGAAGNRSGRLIGDLETGRKEDDPRQTYIRNCRKFHITQPAPERSPQPELVVVYRLCGGEPAPIRIHRVLPDGNHPQKNRGETGACIQLNSDPTPGGRGSFETAGEARNVLRLSGRTVTGRVDRSSRFICPTRE